MELTHRQKFLIHQAQTSTQPLLLEFEKAEGCYLYDTHQKAYLDFISGISVSNLGHGNTSVIDAICHQAQQHMHLMVYGEFVQAPQVLLAQKLAGLLPESLNCSYFVNSGAEAVEGALKLAKRLTGRKEIIACKKAYHGSTHGAMSLNSESFFTASYEPLLPHVRFIDFNDTSALENITEKTACLIVEVIASEQGYVPANTEFLKKARAICNTTGTQLIFDEIQSGMGRSGTLFAFEHDGIIPDILLLGKALGAGMPMGAFISSTEKMSVLASDPPLGHMTTFGGHPVICAAALAGINELERLDFYHEVPAKEQLFRKHLVHPAIQEISGKGLMLAITFESPDFNKKLIDACIADGLITDWFLFAPEKLRISPPLIITEQQIETACEILIKNLNRLYQN